MRWLSAVISLLSVGSALAAKKAPEDRFTKFHTKALSSSPLKLADPSFKDLTGAPRDYSVAVLLTALEARFGCQVCREFQPEWELLSKSWTRGDKAGESRLVFGTLDFSEGRDTFVSVGRPSQCLWLGNHVLTASVAWSSNRPGPPPLPAHNRYSCRQIHGAHPIRFQSWVRNTRH